MTKGVEKTQSDPSQYIEKINLATGELMAEDILPEQLLVQNHRDYHVVDVYARHVMSRMVGATGNEELARQVMKEVRKLGHKTGDWLARAVGIDADTVKETLFGLKDREYYFRYRSPGHNLELLAQVVTQLKADATRKLAAADGVVALLTGGTGFVGKEIIWQVAQDDAVKEMIVVIRPKTIYDRKTKEPVQVISPAERGSQLLDQLWLTEPEQRSRFRFVAGDIEEPDMGISESELETLKTTVTHVIHCAASVAFDDPYEKSFKANVTGCINALRFSHVLQGTEESPFVAHLAVETSYIHGRQAQNMAREDQVVFPRNFYNNYYELTKAMASFETEKFMVEKGLRVVQLCPSIVIGESRAGNNRGDLKVVNAPVNAFGRAHEVMTDGTMDFASRSKGWMLAKMACIFPGDSNAELNIIPVDRVAAGIVAALTRPEAIGERIHLATDKRMRAQRISDIVKEELGVDVKLSEPTIHRTIRLPVLVTLLERFGQPKLGNALQKLGNIFGGYSEWGQPVHQVGNDVTLLGLSPDRPDTEAAFRMLCRHNRYVQQFGQLRDDNEISRREKVWWDFIVDIEKLTNGPAGAMAPEEFRTVLEVTLNLKEFTPK